MHHETDLVTIFSGSPITVDIVRSLLEEARIVCYEVDENMSIVLPFINSPAGTCNIQVSKSDEAAARRAIEDAREHLPEE